MEKYTLVITEYYSKEIEVEAADEGEAWDMVKEAYCNHEIKLCTKEEGTNYLGADIDGCDVYDLVE